MLPSIGNRLKSGCAIKRVNTAGSSKGVVAPFPSATAALLALGETIDHFAQAHYSLLAQGQFSYLSFNAAASSRRRFSTGTLPTRSRRSPLTKNIAGNSVAPNATAGLEAFGFWITCHQRESSSNCPFSEVSEGF